MSDAEKQTTKLQKYSAYFFDSNMSALRIKQN